MRKKIMLFVAAMLFIIACYLIWKGMFETIPFGKMSATAIIHSYHVGFTGWGTLIISLLVLVLADTPGKKSSKTN